MKNLVYDIKKVDEERVVLTLKNFTPRIIAEYPYVSINMMYITYSKKINAITVVYKDGAKKTFYEKGIEVIHYPLMKEFFFRVINFIKRWEDGLD